MSDLILGLRELFISVFFESALALLWISLIISAFSDPDGFAEKPISTQYQWLKNLLRRELRNRNAAIAAASVLLILGYPLGVAMQRATDDFVELGSFWMPKSSKIKMPKSSKIKMPKSSKIKPSPVPWTAIGRDNKIRNDVIEDFAYKLRNEANAALSGSEGVNMTWDKARNIARKAHTRRAFANWNGNESGTYMRELLELVDCLRGSFTIADAM